MSIGDLKPRIGKKILDGGWKKSTKIYWNWANIPWAKYWFILAL